MRYAHDAAPRRALATTALLSRVLVVPKDGVALFRAAEQLDLKGMAPSYETKCGVSVEG